MFLGLAAVFAALDLGAKSLAFATLQQDVEKEIVPKVLYLQLALNSGGLFGLGSQHTEVFVVFSAFTMGLVIWMYLSFGHVQWLTRVALALVFGGAIGNLWDRIFYESVRDFILVYIARYRWPNFNVADVWICVGVGALICWLWTHPDMARGKRQQGEREGKKERLRNKRPRKRRRE